MEYDANRCFRRSHRFSSNCLYPGTADLTIKFEKKLLKKPHIIEFKREDERWENIVEMFTQVKDIDDVQGMVHRLYSNRCNQV